MNLGFILGNFPETIPVLCFKQSHSKVKYLKVLPDITHLLILMDFDPVPCIKISGTGWCQEASDWTLYPYHEGVETDGWGILGSSFEPINSVAIVLWKMW